MRRLPLPALVFDFASDRYVRGRRALLIHWRRHHPRRAPLAPVGHHTTRPARLRRYWQTWHALDPQSRAIEVVAIRQLYAAGETD